MFNYQGNDPIKIQNPIEVTNESARIDHDSQDFGQVFQTVHFLLYMSVIVHQTIQVQLSHVTKSKYDAWGKLFLFNIAAILFVILMSVLRE